jgi:dipeptidyl aminopeptidase/acylaminoacyl peptidase
MKAEGRKQKAEMFAAALFLFATAAFAQPHPINVDDLIALKRVGAPRLSPDGRWVAFDESSIDPKTNARHSVVKLVPASGGDAKAITDGAKQDEGPAWSPDGRTIAYVSNRDSDAKQVWLCDVATGAQRRVSNLAGGAGSVKWMPDGKAVIAVSDIYPECGVDPGCIRQKDAAQAANPSQARVITSLLYRHWKAWQAPTRSHIVYVPLDGSAARDLTPGAFDAPPFSLGGGDEFDVSPDGRELVFARDTEEHPELSTNSDLFLVPIGGGEARRITTRRGADTSPHYSPDGRYIAYRSQARFGYESDLWELWLYDRGTGKSTRVAADFANDVEAMTWAPDSGSLYVIAPYQGTDMLYQVTLDGHYSTLDGFGSVSDIAVARDKQTTYEARSSLTGPTEIYAYDRHTRKSQRLTHDNDALLTSVHVGMSQDFYWTGAENAKIQGHLVTPPGFDRTKKYPAIVLIHGGPQGAWSNAWSYRWNPEIFASRGYVVLMPNPRGSTGFGHEFTEQISGDWGGRVYTDIMNGVDALAALPYVDGSRIGAAGGSFGGYMVDWILGHTNRFKALVSHAGVFNLVSMYGVTEELWFPEFEFKGNPYDNPELYEKWSPVNYVKNFRTPTLVSHGELDFRVPIDQGLQLFTALQRRGVPSKLLYFPDEGHWVLKPQNSRLWYNTVGDWFDQWMKKR